MNLPEEVEAFEELESFIAEQITDFTVEAATKQVVVFLLNAQIPISKSFSWF